MVTATAQENEHSIEKARSTSDATVFKPLGPEEFRLPRVIHVVEPPAGSLIFKCELEIFSLNQAPPFRAISYTWGAATYEMTVEPGKPLEFIESPEPPPVSDRIFVNNHAVSVNHNLYIEFCSLYSQKTLELNSWIWADALCI